MAVEKFQETLKKVQDKGFKWMLEAQKNNKINKQKSKEFLVSIMLNEKDDKVKKELFASIYEFFK